MELDVIQKQGIRLSISKIDKDEEYFVVAKSFITDLLAGIAKLSIKYGQNELIDFPYIYSERQLDSVILPSLSMICNGAVIAELPARRNCFLKNHEINNSFGRIDYWCIYNNYSIVLEVKHSFDGFTRDSTGENNIIKKWEYMTIEQLQSIKDEVKQYEENTKGVIRLGLHVIVSYSDKSPTTHLIQEYRKKLPDILDRLSNDVCRCKPTYTRPDFVASWTPPISFVLNGLKTYPGIILLAKAFKPILHRGAHVKYNDNTRFNKITE